MSASLAAAAALAAAVLLLLARAGVVLCHAPAPAAATMRMDGMPAMVHAATAVAGPGAVCPVLLHAALLAAAAALISTLIAVLTAAAPLARAFAAAAASRRSPRPALHLPRLRVVPPSAAFAPLSRPPGRAPPLRR